MSVWFRWRRAWGGGEERANGWPSWNACVRVVSERHVIAGRIPEHRHCAARVVTTGVEGPNWRSAYHGVFQRTRPKSSKHMKATHTTSPARSHLGCTCLRVPRPQVGAAAAAPLAASPCANTRCARHATAPSQGGPATRPPTTESQRAGWRALDASQKPHPGVAWRGGAAKDCSQGGLPRSSEAVRSRIRGGESGRRWRAWRGIVGGAHGGAMLNDDDGCRGVFHVRGYCTSDGHTASGGEGLHGMTSEV